MKNHDREIVLELIQELRGVKRELERLGSGDVDSGGVGTIKLLIMEISKLSMSIDRAAGSKEE